MSSKAKALLVIVIVVLVGIATVVTYAMMQNNNDDDGTATEPTTVRTQDESDTTPSSQPTDDDSENVSEVTIQNYTYAPANITVKVGTEVTWTNQDGIEHTVTSDDSAPVTFDSGMLGQGESFSFTFDQAGEYEYFCTPHPYMKGKVTVTE